MGSLISISIGKQQRFKFEQRLILLSKFVFFNFSFYISILMRSCPQQILWKGRRKKFILYNVSCILNSKRHQFVSLLLHCDTATFRIFRTHVKYIRNFFPVSKLTNSTCYRLMQSNQSKSRTYALMYSDIYSEGARKKYISRYSLNSLLNNALVFAFIGSFIPCKNVSFDGFL